MRRNILESRLALRGKTLTELATAINMPYSTFGTKLNGRSDFTRAEIKQIKDFLNLSPDDVDQIFFAEEFEKTQTEV